MLTCPSHSEQAMGCPWPSRLGYCNKSARHKQAPMLEELTGEGGRVVTGNSPTPRDPGESEE